MFTHQLVIRRDTRSGIVSVGWARDMPLERYQHIALVAEAAQAGPLDPAAACYALYEDACREARLLNRDILRQQRNSHAQDGWLEVPLELQATNCTPQADRFGSYQQSAMQTLYRLTGNITDVWAAIEDASVIALSARTPPRAMEAVEFQVWKHHTLQRLQKMAGTVRSGKLVVTHTGLWFIPQTTAP